MGSSLEGLDPVFRAKVEALLAASGGKVTIKSARRTTERQSQLWNAALAKYGSVAKARKWVAPPGKSNHEKGAAVDFGGDLALAARLAPRFGLARPLANEPWHYEPVGLRKKAAVGSVRAAERKAAGAVAPAGSVAVSTVEGQERFTFEYQLQSLGNLLAGGATDDG